MNLSRLVLSSALAFSLSTDSFADTFFSNLGQATNATANFTANQQWASDFLTANFDTSITGITVTLINTATQPRTITVSIYSDLAGAPGTLLGAFQPLVVPENTGGFANFSTSSTGVNLTQNTAYWVVYQAPEPNAGLSWAGNTDNGVDLGSQFATIASTPLKVSTDGGLNYSDSVSGDLKYALTGTVIPEPTTTIMLVAAASCSVCCRRRYPRD